MISPHQPSDPVVGARSGVQAANAEVSVSQHFTSLATANPDGPAVIHPSGDVLTYGELHARAEVVASAAVRHGAQRSDMIGIAASDVEDTVVGMIAALMAGRPFVTLDPSDPSKRIERILSDSNVRSLLVNSQRTDVDFGSAGHELELIDISSIPEEIGKAPLPPVLPDDLSHVLYTSGSTGLPKGVVHRHRNLLNKALLSRHHYGISSTDRVSLLFSPGMGAGVGDIFTSLLNGAAVCPYDMKSNGFHNMGAWLAERGITVLHTVPTVLRRFLEAVEGAPKFSSVRIIILAGEAAYGRDVELYRRQFADECVLVYRLSANETGVIANYVVNQHTRVDDGLLPVGYPADDKRISLLNDTGDPVAEDQVGEITVESKYLARGYWNNDDLTRAAFSEGPNGRRAYRTGDLGRFRSDGLLEYYGRKDHRMKIHGHTIEPREVERALQAVARFKEVAVVGHDLASSDPQMVAYLVSEHEQALSVADLRLRLAESLPAYMLPSAFVYLQALPLTTLGKVDKNALRPPERAHRRNESDFVEPNVGLESELARIWSEVLDISNVGANDDYFDLGGTSIQALQVFALIARRLDVDMPSTELLRARTVRALAEVVSGGDWGSTQDSLVLVGGSGPGRPFFCVHGGGGGILFVDELLRRMEPGRPIYGLQARGFEGRPGPYRTIEELAAQYLEEIRSVQPYGPYLLGGLSFGGKVAYEIAQQLEATGEKADLVAIIDSKAYPNERERGSDQHRAAMATMSLRYRVAYVMSGVGRRATRLGRGLLLRYYLWRKLELPDTFGLRNFYFYPMHSRAYRAYVPRPYAGDLVVFSAHGGSQLHADTWGVLADGYEIHEIECSHRDLIREPHVGVLAEHLQAHLDQVGGHSSG